MDHTHTHRHCRLQARRDVKASHSLNSYVDPALGQLWAESTFDEPAGRTLSFDTSVTAVAPKRSSTSFVFGENLSIQAGLSNQQISGVIAYPPNVLTSPLRRTPPPPPSINSMLPFHSIQQLQSMLRGVGVVAKPWEVARA
jgi:hypothetical protein